MARIRIQRNHGLGITEARKRVEELAGYLKEKLKAEYYWERNSLKFKCPGASGCIDVGEENLEMNLTLGILLSPMKGSICESIEKYMDAALQGHSPDTGGS